MPNLTVDQPIQRKRGRHTVHVLNNGAMSALVKHVSGPADIGIDTKRNVLVVPRFTEDKIEFDKIP